MLPAVVMEQVPAAMVQATRMTISPEDILPGSPGVTAPEPDAQAAFDLYVTCEATYQSC